MREAAREESAARIHLVLSGGKVSDFVQLIQRGFGVRGEVGCSVAAFLSEQLGLSPSYVDEKILTIFLDGKPVDDIHTARLKDGSILALSGAMPGLVGATLRRAGFYASLRSQISYRDEGSKVATAQGMITLKLFNVLAYELGARFLRSGIWIGKRDLEDCTRNQSPDFWRRCRGATVNGREIDPRELCVVRGTTSSDLVHFSVSLEEKE